MIAYTLSFARMTTRIVIDTNIFISAIIGSNGPNRNVIRRCFENIYQPLMGNALFCEYEEVKTRPNVVERCSLSKREIATLLNSFMSISEWVSIFYLWRPNLSDEHDNHIIELAVAGGAEYIVTSNTKDFKKGELLFPDINIVTPAQLLRQN